MDIHDKITIPQLKEIINSRFGVESSIRTNKSKSVVAKEKKIFKRVIKRIEEIDERSTQMLEKYKIDLSDFEDEYFEVIELLFNLHYTAVQIDIIKAYLYINRDEHGNRLETIEITKDKKTQVYPFKTVDDLWDVIQKVQ